MMATLHSMPDQARLWVYQADRQLSSMEVDAVAKAAKMFLAEWAAHGQELRAAFDVQYDQFLIIAVDESSHGASGCSIDASVSMIRDLERELKVSFLDRTKVALLKGNQIEMVPLGQVKSLVADGSISTDARVINNSVSTLGDWKNAWIQPVADSWMGRFFN